MDNVSIVYQHTGEPERPGRISAYHYKRGVDNSFDTKRLTQMTIT